MLINERPALVRAPPFMEGGGFRARQFVVRPDSTWVSDTSSVQGLGLRGV